MINLELLQKPGYAYIYVETLEELNEFYDFMIQNHFPATNVNAYADICKNGRKCVGEENRNFALNRFKPGINFKFFCGEFESCQAGYLFDYANRGAISYKQLLVSECEIDKNSLIDLLDI